MTIWTLNRNSCVYTDTTQFVHDMCILCYISHTILHLLRFIKWDFGVDHTKTSNARAHIFLKHLVNSNRWRIFLMIKKCSSEFQFSIETFFSYSNFASRIAWIPPKQKSRLCVCVWKIQASLGEIGEVDMVVSRTSKANQQNCIHKCMGNVVYVNACRIIECMYE